MDRRERAGNSNAMMLAALEGHQSTMWTSLPGYIVSFNAAKQTAQVQPTLKCQVEQTDGTFEWVQMPVLQDVPVYFPKGGGVSLTFPVKANDECLLVFASRCIDSWWQSGGIQVQADKRMHDLSDAFAFVGFSSVPNVVSAISTTTAQLRSDDGNAFVELNPSSHQIHFKTSGDILGEAGGDVKLTGATIELIATTSISLKAPTIQTQGNFAGIGYSGAGTVSFSNMTVAYSGGSMTFNGKRIDDSHTHGGVTTGAGSTAVPN